MANLDRPLGLVDPWDRINAWPDHKPLKSKEAAIFCRVSESTMQRHRKHGTGPDYFQAGIKHAGAEPAEPLGPNQHILYFKEDINAWWQANKVGSMIMAAAKKGQTFVYVHDLAEDEAFYVDKQGNVESLVEDNTLGTLIDRLGEWEVVWMPALEAASRRWTNLASHQEFAGHVQRVLRNAVRGVEQGLEATEIRSATPEGNDSQPVADSDRAGQDGRTL
jgi:hypothetical protein